MNATTPTTFTTTDTEGLAELLAMTEESLCLEDLHPMEAARYRGLASRLATGGHARDLEVIAEVIALDLEDAGDIDQVAPWLLGRHRVTAEDILNQF
ncbi:hypothetical protein ACFY0N_00490 [Streptomyces vinaceus]|uniref:hypothetical protein n=1 Tax=Streptomyces vinaceus TaxID=1960 RepID=UPI0036C0D6CD